jgi:rod shape-determining protein MreC
MIERTNARAILTGDGGPNPRLDYLRGHEPVKEGDRILTSGDGGVIPRGLPVGFAVKGLDGKWRVVLASDRAPIDFVRILLFKDFTQLVNQKELDVMPVPPPTPGAPVDAPPVAGPTLPPAAKPAAPAATAASVPAAKPAAVTALKPAATAATTTTTTTKPAPSAGDKTPAAKPGVPKPGAPKSAAAATTAPAKTTAKPAAVKAATPKPAPKAPAPASPPEEPPH